MSMTAPRNGLSKLQLLGILASSVIVAVTQFIYVQAVIYPGLFGPDEVTRTEVQGEYIAFVLRAPNTAISEESSKTEAGCTAVQYVMNNHQLVVNAHGRGCVPPRAPQQIRNGYHGSYRTLDDVPAPIDVEEIDIPLGKAEVFIQKYSESTMFSREWEEPVAVVTFDEPVNADFPTMVITSQKAALDREHFTAIVAGLLPFAN